MMLIPLLIGALIRTLFPATFSVDNAVFSKSFTGGLLTGAIPLLAAFYVCLGSTIEFRSTAYILRKGAALWISKIATAFVIAFLIRSFASDQNHIVLGLSGLAVVAAFSDTNGGLYMALMAQLGKRAEDVAAYSIMSIESGPFFTMLILGVVGLAYFPLLAFIYALLPLVLGMFIGNLDPKMRDFLRPGVALFIPFFALALGTSIDLRGIVMAGTSGIVLGVLVVVVTGTVLFLADRLTGGNGLAGIAASSTAGNAAIVPIAVAAIYPAYQPIAAIAVVQVSAAVVVTAILTPIATAWYAHRIAGADEPRAQRRANTAA